MATAQVDVVVTGTGIDETQAKLLTLQNTGKKVDQTFGDAVASSGRLERGLVSLASRATGVNSELGHIVGTLLSFGGGEAAVIALAVAVGGIALAFNKISEATNKATADIKKFNEEMMKSVQDQPLVKARTDLSTANSNLAELRQKLADLNATTAEGFDEDLPPLIAAQQRLKAINDLQNLINQATIAQGIAQKAYNDERDRTIKAHDELGKKETENANKALEDADRQTEAEIKLLQRSQERGELDSSGLAKLHELQAVLTKEVQNTNAADAERILKLDQQLDLVTHIIDAGAASAAAASGIGLRYGEGTAPTGAGGLNIGNEGGFASAQTQGTGRSLSQGFGPAAGSSGASFQVPTSNTDITSQLSDTTQIVLSSIADQTNEITEAQKKQQEEIKKQQAEFGKVLSQGIEQAFQLAFEGKGAGAAIDAFGKTVLAGIGKMFVQMGESYLNFGSIVAPLEGLLGNPATAGPAGLAIGAALIALGSVLSAAASTGGTGGTSGGTTAPANNITNTVFNSPGAGLSGAVGNLSSGPTVNATIIGPNDPQAQRSIAKLVQNAQARGYSITP